MTAPKPPSAADIKAQYGFVTALARAIPEIGSLIKKAVAQKWTAERMQMEVANTKWWKATPSPTRQWLTQKIADPASATQALQAGGTNVHALAGGLGLPLTVGKAQEIWLYGQLHGYDEQAMRGLIFRNLQNRNALPGDDAASGEYGTLLTQARELAAAYGYNPKDLANQVRAAAGSGLQFGDVGQDALAGWQTKLKNYAKAKYAAFADRFEQGETVMDIAQPYIDAYSQVLEVNPQDVSLDDKYVQKALQGQSQAGKPPAAQAVWQFQQELRKDPRWGFTQNARQSAAEAITILGQKMGMIG